MASILWLPVVFCAGTMLLYGLAVNLPELDQSATDDATNQLKSRAEIKFPSSLAELRALRDILSQYTSSHPTYVLMLFCTAYIYKQTFAIPGSVFLNILAGSLFGVWYGFPLCCLLTAVGATNCFLLSKFFGKQYVIRYLANRIESIRQKLHHDSGSLFLFLLSLRLFPMAPNWLMNMAAPVLNIPVYLFFPSVLIGLMPYNFLCVESGSLLSELTSTSSILTATTMAKLFAAAIALLVPSILFRSRSTVATTEMSRAN